VKEIIIKYSRQVGLQEIQEQDIGQQIFINLGSGEILQGR